MSTITITRGVSVKFRVYDFVYPSSFGLGILIVIKPRFDHCCKKCGYYLDYLRGNESSCPCKMDICFSNIYKGVLEDEITQFSLILRRLSVVTFEFSVEYLI
jgi:hypothetical protein